MRLHVGGPGIVVAQAGKDRSVGEVFLEDLQPDGGVLDVARPGLQPNVVRRKVPGHQDEVDVWVVLADLLHHVSERPFGHVADIVAPVTGFLHIGDSIFECEQFEDQIMLMDIIIL